MKTNTSPIVAYAHEQQPNAQIIDFFSGQEQNLPSAQQAICTLADICKDVYMHREKQILQEAKLYDFAKYGVMTATKCVRTREGIFAFESMDPRLRVKDLYAMIKDDQENGDILRSSDGRVRFSDATVMKLNYNPLHESQVESDVTVRVIANDIGATKLGKLMHFVYDKHGRANIQYNLPHFTDCIVAARPIHTLDDKLEVATPISLTVNTAGEIMFETTPYLGHTSRN